MHLMPDENELFRLLQGASSGPWDAEYDRDEPVSVYGNEVMGLCDRDHLDYQEALRCGEIQAYYYIGNESPLGDTPDICEVKGNDALFLVEARNKTGDILQRLSDLRERHAEVVLALRTLAREVEGLPTHSAGRVPVMGLISCEIDVVETGDLASLRSTAKTALDLLKKLGAL